MSDGAAQHIIDTIKLYGSKLFGFIRQRVHTTEDAEDVLQDVWHQLSNAVHIEEIRQMNGWLHRVARNKIIDRQRKKVPELLEDYAGEDEEGEWSMKDLLLMDADANPETEYLKDIFWQELFTALEELPPAQRDAFVWNELDDFTLQEIADKTGENIKTVISRKGYAVKHLRKRLQTLYDEFLDY
jgi:RNA polymerase sigma factor (sigma-70 family)